MKAIKPLPDEALIEQFKAGNKEAMTMLYKRYAQKVYYKCFSFVKDEQIAHDLAQDAMLKVLEKAHHFGGNSSFSTWLYSVVYNHCVDYTRKVNRDRLLLPAIGQQTEYLPPDLEGELELDRKRMALDHLLADLPQNDREMLLAKYRDNASVQQIMNDYGLNASAVKMRIKRAKEKVRALYAEYRAPHETELFLTSSAA